MKIKVRRRMSVWRFLALGYFILILFGAFLLTLPVSSQSGEWTHFVDALFTATSATCVTGLTPVVTGVHWNLFGQIVIICLIQTGGLGFTTFVTLIFMAGLFINVNYIVLPLYLMIFSVGRAIGVGTAIT